MAYESDKDEIISAADAAFPDSYVQENATFWEGSHSPKDMLARFVVATIDDLCGENSSQAANLERVALALEVGSASLENVSQTLRQKSTS